MYKVGSIATLLVPCLGNKIGTRGVCYELYTLGNYSGASFIFENGNYDGFSVEEQKEFLLKDKDTTFSYNFKSVMQLSQDFDRGLFNPLFQRS